MALSRRPARAANLCEDGFCTRCAVLSCGFEADGCDERIKIIDNAIVETIERRASDECIGTLLEWP